MTGVTVAAWVAWSVAVTSGVISIGFRRGAGRRRRGSALRGAGLLCGVRAHQRHVVDGEGPFPADVAGEREPPAEHRADPVAIAGKEADVDEQPDPPAHEAAEVHPARGDHSFPAGDVGGRAQVMVAEWLVEALPPGQMADPAPGVQSGLDRKSTRL